MLFQTVVKILCYFCQQLIISSYLIWRNSRKTSGHATNILESYSLLCENDLSMI